MSTLARLATSSQVSRGSVSLPGTQVSMPSPVSLVWYSSRPSMMRSSGAAVLRWRLTHHRADRRSRHVVDSDGLDVGSCYGRHARPVADRARRGRIRVCFPFVRRRKQPRRRRRKAGVVANHANSAVFPAKASPCSHRKCCVLSTNDVSSARSPSRATRPLGIGWRGTLCSFDGKFAGGRGCYDDYVVGVLPSCGSASRHRSMPSKSKSAVSGRTVRTPGDSVG